MVSLGEYTCSDVTCRVSVAADLFFCNSSGLHLAFVSMDVFLRLKDPLRPRGGSHSSAAAVGTGGSLLVVWLGAPWSVSAVQTAAEFALSGGGRPLGGACFVADRNYVTLLGLVFAYVIPGVVAAGFLVLSRRQLLRFEGRVVCNATSPHPSQEEVEEEEKEEEDGMMQTENDVAWNQSPSTSCDDSDDVTSALSSSGGTEAAGRHDVIVTELPEKGFRTSSGSDVERPFEERSRSCQGRRLHREAAIAGGVPRTRDRVSKLSRNMDLQLIPDEGLHRELSMYQLIWILVAIHIALWFPASVSGAIYSLCRNCCHNMTFTHFMTFKWLAYSSSAVSSIANCCRVNPIKRSCMALLNAEKRRRKNRRKPCNCHDPVMRQ